ncbi:MAG: c-type cytochrome [Methyloceanibacter sp.]|uniref:c-type cytochrome n=1 Tax=Methyloceanibacter sp. TaxID=1965321 RepID=UPI003D9BBBF2
MRAPLCMHHAVAVLALLAMPVQSALAAPDSGAAIEGKTILEAHCARCHSIAATGPSPLKQAPPLREIYLRDPIEELEGRFAEGMGSRHCDMPQIQFSTEQVAAHLDLSRQHPGMDPAKRERAPVSGDMPP